MLFSSCKNQKNYPLYVFFDNVDGLQTNAGVEVNGFTIGKVEKMKLVKNQILVTLSIDNEAQIPQKSIFVIQSRGLMGPIYIRAFLDEASTKFYVPNDTIQGKRKEEVDINVEVKATPKLSTILDTLVKGLEKLEEASNKFKK